MCIGPRPTSKREHAIASSRSLPTKADIRNAIPAHCFERSAARSLGLVVRDLMIVGALGYAAATFLPTQLGAMEWYHVVGWSVYAFLQGTAMTGLWVLAHECGHGGFSDSKVLNDIVGFPLHTALLVPYYSWQYSHAKHHSKTNHLLDGETHVPMTKSTFHKAGMAKIHDAVGEEAFAVIYVLYMCLLGWPLYLLQNATGARRSIKGKSIKGHTLDHFRPNSILFPKAWALRVAMSTVGIFAWFGVLGYAGTVYGFAPVFLLYFPAYLWTNAWLVLYTFLHHTSNKVPQFGEDEWTWVKGALCTIDRNYAGFDWIHHNIGSTHVAHHLFSDLPCYHAVEATKHVRAFLEPKGLYNIDNTYWVKALFQTAKECHYVDTVRGVQYLQQHTGKAEAKAQ